MLENWIKKKYLENSDNLVYNDYLTGCKTKLYYDDILKDKYKDKEVFIAIINIFDLKGYNKFSFEDGDNMIKDVYRSLLNLLINREDDERDIVRNGNIFLFITDKSFDRVELNSIEDIYYGYDYKKKGESLDNVVYRCYKYMLTRGEKMHRNDNKK